MSRYRVHIICDDGEQGEVLVNVDENDPLFEQAVALTAAEMGLKFASIDTIEFLGDEE